MDSDNELLYLERAENELDLAKSIFKISRDNELKLRLGLKEGKTFFSNVISNAYYCIFYCAKAYLLVRGIRTKPPEEHKKSYEEFKKLAILGKIDNDLLEIYESIVIKADELLGIFKKEKSKRGKFTYKKLPQSNLEPAQKSLDNAEKFFRNINAIIEKNKEVKKENEK